MTDPQALAMCVCASPKTVDTMSGPGPEYCLDCWGRMPQALTPTERTTPDVDYEAWAPKEFNRTAVVKITRLPVRYGHALGLTCSHVPPVCGEDAGYMLEWKNGHTYACPMHLGEILKVCC
jgi:hypothetical protein